MAGFLETLRKQVLLSDGAMGTQLQAAGLQPGECGDEWVLIHPEKVLAIQSRYVDAGSDCISTNTFGASRLSLERHGLGEKVAEINRRAAEIARESFGDQPGFVLGDIGPFGGLLEPYGTVSADRARVSFAEQAGALVGAGVDAIIIETMTALEELELAVLAARDAGAESVIASVSFDLTHDGSDVRTMMGVTPERAAEFLQKIGVDVAGTNCGASIDIGWAARIIERYRQNCDLLLMAQPNAGTPSLEGERIVYKTDPETMASAVPDLISAGARLVGACCGSRPAHIRAFRKILDQTDMSQN
jgi:5-methyltetrahydrofolate--homocysteine methyltransferase